MPVSEPTLKERLLIWLRRPADEKLKSLAYHFNRMTDLAYERSRGLDFRGIIPREDLATEHAVSLSHATAYEPCASRNLAILMREAAKIVSRFDRFVDIGSGKGKACIFAARSRRFGQVMGVEFAQSLVEIANRNASKSQFRQRQVRAR